MLSLRGLRARPLIAQGNAARDRKDWREAARLYRDALAIDPDRAAIWVQFGHMLKESGDRDEAARAYGRAVGLEPDNADTHLQIGHLKKLEGDRDGAAASYARALELDRNLQDAARELAFLGRGAEAERILAGQNVRAPAPSSDRDRIIELEGRLQAIAGQMASLLEHVSATRALGFEIAHTRASLNDGVERLGRLEGATAELRAEIAAQSDILEDTGQKAEALASQFPAFLEHVSATRALAFDLSRAAQRLDAAEAMLKAQDDVLDLAARRLEGHVARFVQLDRVLATQNEINEKAEQRAENLEEALEDLGIVLKRQSGSLEKLAEAGRVQEVGLRDVAVRAAQQEASLREVAARMERQEAGVGSLAESLKTQDRLVKELADRLERQDDALDAVKLRVDAQASALAEVDERGEAQIETIGKLAETLRTQEAALGQTSAVVDRLRIAAEAAETRFDAQAMALTEVEGRRESQIAALAAVHERLAAELAANGAKLTRLAESVPRPGDIQGIRALAEAAMPKDQFEREVTDLRQSLSGRTGGRRLAELQKTLDAFMQEANGTMSYLLGRVEFVRQEMLYEFRYGARDGQMGDRLRAEPALLNPEKVEAARASGRISLNVGCGHIPEPGYLNVDRRALPGVDIVAEADDLPFEPASVREIRSSHLVEHFPEEALIRSLLPHWKSRLEPGGRLLAIVPDGETMLAEHAAGRYPFEDLREVLYGGQDYEGDFHYDLLTPASLEALLKGAGFTGVRLIEKGRRNGKCYEFEMEAFA